MSTTLNPASFARGILVVSSDIPADMTLAQWRSQNGPVVQMSRRRRRRVKRIMRRRRAL
jgi:hypothetical protein